MHTQVDNSMIHKSQEAEATHPQRMDKVWCMHTYEYYSTLKREEILTQATTWMNLKDTTLSERSQWQKEESCVGPFKWYLE